MSSVGLLCVKSSIFPHQINAVLRSKKSPILERLIALGLFGWFEGVRAIERPEMIGGSV